MSGVVLDMVVDVPYWDSYIAKRGGGSRAIKYASSRMSMAAREEGFKVLRGTHKVPVLYVPIKLRPFDEGHGLDAFADFAKRANLSEIEEWFEFDPAWLEQAGAFMDRWVSDVYCFYVASVHGGIGSSRGRASLLDWSLCDATLSLDLDALGEMSFFVAVAVGYSPLAWK